MRNEGKIEALFRTTGGLFGSSGFPGEPIQAFLRDQIHAFEAYVEGLERGARVLIHELAVHGIPRPQPGSRRFLLVYQIPSPRANAILQDPAVRVVDQASFRSLDLYELIWQ